MFKINKLLQDNSIELTNSIISSNCKIHLNQGASVQKLVLNAKEIIKDCHPLTYKESYASAIMFPFAGRIENGVYSFQNKEYQLYQNDSRNNCAMHGLLYNKKFKLIEEQTTQELARVTLRYVSDGTAQGFPFKYEFTITYILTKSLLKAEVTVRNLDKNSFPFSLGWHPYFYSKNLKESFLSFSSNSQAVFNDKMLVEKFTETTVDESFKIKDQLLDDCYTLASDNLCFTTPDYKVEFATNPKHNFLQIYTPPAHKNFIAIEPITAPANCFNNKIGLQVLESEAEYTASWQIKEIHK